jgi:hypothetical protein
MAVSGGFDIESPMIIESDGGSCRRYANVGVVIPKLMAVSDVHVGHQGNRPVVEQIRADSPEDWLIVAGDVGV